MSVRSTCMSYINARIISLQILQKIHADSWSQEFARIKTRLGWWQCIHDIFHNHPWMRSLQPSIDHVCFRNPFPWTSQFPDPEEAFPVFSDIRWKWNQLCWVKGWDIGCSSITCSCSWQWCDWNIHHYTGNAQVFCISLWHMFVFWVFCCHLC